MSVLVAAYKIYQQLLFHVHLHQVHLLQQVVFDVHLHQVHLLIHVSQANSVNNQDTGEDNSNVLNQKMGQKSGSDFASRDLYAGKIDWNLSKCALAQTSESSQSSSSACVTKTSAMQNLSTTNSHTS